MFWFLIWKVQLVMVIITLLSYLATCNYICIKIALYPMAFSHTYWLYILKKSLCTCLCILKFWHVLYPCTDQQKFGALCKDRKRSYSPENRMNTAENCKEVDHQRRWYDDYEVISPLWNGMFGQVKLAKRSEGGHSSSEELYALNIVPSSRMSTVEKKSRTADLPLFVQLVDYFETKVSCGLKQFTSMH
jgi:hypothetical protein